MCSGFARRDIIPADYGLRHNTPQEFMVGYLHKAVMPEHIPDWRLLEIFGVATIKVTWPKLKLAGGVEVRP